MIDRQTYWQGAYTMPKGSFADMQARGIERFRAELRSYLPFLGDRVESIRDWDDVGFLEVRVDRLRRWYRPGLLCIGDAAHAMSPIGGVGINLAVQDAVATANLLAAALLAGRVAEVDLARVQRRRELPTRVTQALQLLMQRTVISRVMEGKNAAELPKPVLLGVRTSLPGRLLARVIAVGFRPEHVRVPAPRAGAARSARQPGR